MIKAGVFDVGGVLHERSSKYIYKDIMHTLNISEEVFENNWKIVEEQLGKGRITENEFWQEFLKKTKSNKRLPQESLFLREFIKNYHRNDKVLDIVKRLKNKGYKTAILSNTVRPHADYNNKIGLYQQFDIVILSNEVGMRKPEHEIYKYLLKKLQLKSNEVFYVDDDIENIKAGKKLGIHSIYFKNAKQLENNIIKLGVKI